MTRMRITQKSQDNNGKVSINCLNSSMHVIQISCEHYEKGIRQYK